MEAAALFVRTLDDLDARVRSTDDYYVLMSALLLRKLLLDSRPLVEEVNAAYHLKIRYPMNGETPYERLVLNDGPLYWSLEDAIDPSTDHPPGLLAPITATRGQLLGRRVMRLNGRDVTVRDLIDQLAHIEGAVHHAAPKNEREVLLSEASRVIYVGGLPSGIRQIRAIGRVVLRGLAPLRAAVLESMRRS